MYKYIQVYTSMYKYIRLQNSSNNDIEVYSMFLRFCELHFCQLADGCQHSCTVVLDTG